MGDGSARQGLEPQQRIRTGHNACTRVWQAAPSVMTPPGAGSVSRASAGLVKGPRSALKNSPLTSWGSGVLRATAASGPIKHEAIAQKAPKVPGASRLRTPLSTSTHEMRAETCAVQRFRKPPQATPRGGPTVRWHSQGGNELIAATPLASRYFKPRCQAGRRRECGYMAP